MSPLILIDIVADAFADDALVRITIILSAPLMLPTVTVAAPVKAVPPELINDQLVPAAAGAAHLIPRLSELSATKSAILQEQSQRIVVDIGIIPLLK